MDLEWDEAKRQANIRKHHIDFADVGEVFNGDIVIIEDDRFDYGERRFVVFGLFRGHIVAVVYTEHGNVMRIISARKATKNEERDYFDQIRY
ncbi:MAG: BrnT family toxin [Anaerolineae bacterium]|nr:BrnT family toxin [Anaerolineae bacterium]